MPNSFFTLCLILCISQPGDSMKYFTSPEDAAAVVTQLLIEKDWQTLAHYYFLGDTAIDIRDIAQEKFFVRKSEAESHHPTDDPKIFKPFDPSYAFDHAEEQGDTVTVWMIKKVDQGNDLEQIGMQSFLLKRTEKGLQLLP